MAHSELSGNKITLKEIQEKIGKIFGKITADEVEKRIAKIRKNNEENNNPPTLEKKPETK
jgi:hypothetical protein